MTYLEELRTKWLPIFKEGNVNSITLKMYNRDVKSYKKSNPHWRETNF